MSDTRYRGPAGEGFVLVPRSVVREALSGLEAFAGGATGLTQGYLRDLLAAPQAAPVTGEEGDYGRAPLIDFLDELAGNAAPGQRKALNPILIGGAAAIYARAMRDALRFPPHPGDAERVDLGELERLSKTATNTEWRVFDSRNVLEIQRKDGGTIVHWSGFDQLSGTSARKRGVNASFIVALVNAYRSGLLVPASRPAGTGVGDQTGAPASPSGHSRAEPSGLGASPECPSRGPHYRWAPKDEYGLWRCPDCFCHSFAMIASENALIRCVNCKEVFSSVRDRSGEAGETEGLDRRQEPGPERATPTPSPTPSPAEEAKALLERLDPEFGPPEIYAKALRCLDFNDHADVIEAALATIRSSQAGEVRDDG